MTLFRSRISNEDDVLGVVHEAMRCKVPDLCIVDGELE